MSQVLFYFNLTENISLNTSHGEASGLEWAGNVCLIPYQYLFAGSLYNHSALKYRFGYNGYPVCNMLKTAASIITLPVSMVAGSAFKGLSLLSESARSHHREIATFSNLHDIAPRQPSPLVSAEKAVSTATRILRPSTEVLPSHEQKLGSLFANVSETHQKEIAALSEKTQKDILALQELGELLDKHKIPWWIDAGTLLGACRHEGMIPWDHDIDVSIRHEDHDDVLRAAKEPNFAKKYRIMDWSPADQPRTLLKLYVRETRSLIDIYHYKISKNQSGEETITYLSPYHNKWYVPHVIKVREVYCFVTQPASVIFPLKTALFDGVKVRVPNQPEVHLKSMYGNNLSPSKVWDASKKKYVNVSGHPYWEKCDE